MSYLEQRRKFIEDGRPLPPKKKYVIPKKSAKRIQKEKEQGIEIVKPKKAGWFDAERIEAVNIPDGELVEIVETNRPIANNGKSGELWRWFEKQRERMTGKCAHCGGKTQKHDNDTFHYSIAHILPKSIFKSIATHDESWIELCYYGNSCHTNYDHHTLDLADLNCFDLVIEKITKLYPHIAPSERRRIPAILLEYIKTNL